MAIIDIEATKNQARALLDSRIKSVEELIKARQRVTDLKEKLAAAERDDKRAYVKATRDERRRTQEARPRTSRCGPQAQNNNRDHDRGQPQHV